MRRLARLVAIAAVLAPAPAAALPAVLVGAAPAKLRNHRSHLVVVQDGARTTLSLQLDVLAVPMDLAIVLPIPGEVDPDSLHALDRRLFERLDALAAPRLEHVWEQNPCLLHPPPKPVRTAPGPGYPGWPREHPRPTALADGEYDFAVLGRVGAGELETWLRERGFPMTDAHHAALAEHFTAGAQFVVARVDRRQVFFNARGQAVLSPFRVAFQADPDWRLPLRAGLGHSLGAQDVVIHAIAHGRRISLDPPPATASGELDVLPIAADRFADVHAAVFTAALASTATRGLVEHAAPLAEGLLATEELAALGLSGAADDLVLSRLHLHYAPADLADDPRLATVPADHDLQLRYLVRHPWPTKTRCAAPRHDVWGPPPDGAAPDVAVNRHVHSMSRADPVADLTPYLAADVPALELHAAPASGCAIDPSGSTSSSRDVAFAGLLALALRRRRSARRPAACE